MRLRERLYGRGCVFSFDGGEKGDIEVAVEYDRRKRKAWVTVYLGPGFRRLFEFLDKRGFEGDWDCSVWRGYDMERDTVRELVKELKAMGFKVKYEEFYD